MKEAYETSSEMNYTEYKKMCQVLNGRRIIILAIIISGFLLASGLFLLIMGSIVTGGFFLVLAAGYPLLLWGVFTRSVRKSFSSQKLLENRHIHYEFLEDRFIARSDISRAEIRYDLLYRIVETKTNFYLLLGPNQSFLVKKENCSGELTAFLGELRKRHK